MWSGPRINADTDPSLDSVHVYISHAIYFTLRIRTISIASRPQQIAGGSPRLNTIRRERTTAVRFSYGCRTCTTVVRALRNRRCVVRKFARQSYEFVRQLYEFVGQQKCISTVVRPVRLQYDCRTTFVRLSYELSTGFFMHVFILHANLFTIPFDFSL